MIEQDDTAEPDARILAAVTFMRDLLVKGGERVDLTAADLRNAMHDQDGRTMLSVCGHGTASGPDRARLAAEAALADLRDQLAALRSDRGEGD